MTDFVTRDVGRRARRFTVSTTTGVMPAPSYWLRVWRIKSRVWVTTSGKSNFALVSRWTLIRAAFARKDVHLRG